jgi:hypothetical protein
MAPFDAAGHTIALAKPLESVSMEATDRCVDAVDRAMSAYEQLRTTTIKDPVESDDQGVVTAGSVRYDTAEV